nr:MAG TPA: hypothetical protein [Caudoviricetes sp.]
MLCQTVACIPACFCTAHRSTSKIQCGISCLPAAGTPTSQHNRACLFLCIPGRPKNAGYQPACSAASRAPPHWRSGCCPR